MRISVDAIDEPGSRRAIQNADAIFAIDDRVRLRHQVFGPDAGFRELLEIELDGNSTEHLARIARVLEAIKGR